MIGEGAPPPLPPEQVAEAVAGAVRSMGRPATASLLRRGNGTELHVVSGPGGSVVVKRAAGSRLRREAAMQRMIAERMPGRVPSVVAAVPAIDGFAMELVAPGAWAGWDTVLAMGGGAWAAADAGAAVAHLHRIGASDAALRAAAADGNPAARAYANEIRRAATRGDPPLEAPIAALLDDMLARHTTVLHGDLHAGNFLVGGGPPVMVDFELCWSGDAACDTGKLVGFTIGQLLGRPGYFGRAPMRAVIRDAFSAWQAGVDWEPEAAAGRRAVRFALLVALAIARELERRPGTPPPSLAAQRAVARRMLLDGVDAIGPLVDNLVPPDRG